MGELIDVSKLDFYELRVEERREYVRLEGELYELLSIREKLVMEYRNRRLLNEDARLNAGLVGRRFDEGLMRDYEVSFVRRMGDVKVRLSEVVNRMGELERECKRRYDILLGLRAKISREQLAELREKFGIAD